MVQAGNLISIPDISPAKRKIVICNAKRGSVFLSRNTNQEFRLIMLWIGSWSAQWILSHRMLFNLSVSQALTPA